VLTGGLTPAARSFLQVIADGAGGPAPAGYRSAGQRERACPVCREPLVPRVHQPTRMEIDLCLAHGTYFDVREIDVVAREADLQIAAAEAAAHVAAADADYARLQGAVFGTPEERGGMIGGVLGYLVSRRGTGS
jgi:hypothetical protein